MHNKLLEQCWEIILQKDAKKLANHRAPMMNVDKYAAYFKLQPHPQLQTQIEKTSVISLDHPAFKNLSEENLLALRQNLHTTTDIDTVALWAEKMMRFCEVKFPTFRKRAVEKWGDQATARLQVLHMVAFLLDFYFFSKDLRYLNTVLKLTDLGWLISKKTLRKDLKEEKGPFVSALFQFRILLMTEYAIEQLNY